MTFINHHQKIFRKIIQQTERACTRFASVKKARIVFNAFAEAHLVEHFQVETRTLFDALQFDLARKVDKAAQDVQAAINAAIADLPSDMPALPSVRKANPAAAPILVLALPSVFWLALSVPPFQVADEPVEESAEPTERAEG